MELPNIIDFGKANLQDDYLFFYHTIAEAEAQQKSTVLFSSSTLQYVPNPMVGNLLDRVNVEDLYDQYY